LDAVCGTKPWGHDAPLGVLHWLDLPFSLALDTLLLPVTGVLSCIPEGRDYNTVDRRRIDQLIEDHRAASIRSSLIYLGSEDGYHYLRFSQNNRAVAPYRVRETDLRIEATFPRTEHRATSAILKGPDDPWPLPEPLKERRP
jgi:hypothetical protein